MSEQTDLATMQFTDSAIQKMQQLAPVAHLSRLFRGISTPGQAMIIMLTGAEHGFEPMAALQNFEMIEGKVSMKPQAMLAKVHASKNFDIKITDMPEGCLVYMRRRDTGFEYTASFSKNDAIQAGLIRPNSGYEKYTADMYRARAIARAARVAAPDILAGLYLTTELRNEPSPDDMIEGEVIVDE